MEQYLSVIKGIHPGFILDRELKKRKLQKSKFAQTLHEYPQTIVAITKGRRGINTALALKIEKLLRLEEGILMILQAYYDIEQEKKKQYAQVPDLTKLRSVLFWDTDIANIDWEKQRNAVIKRVFERGNENEKEEISRFYGQNTVSEAMTSYGK